MKHTPFGYKIVDGKAVIDEVAAGQVREVYKGFLEGKSLVVAARDVGIEAYHGSVTRMLANKKYLGTDYYPQIIDQETFDKALEEKHRRKNALGRTNRKKPKKEKVLPIAFHFKPAELSYTDPFEQAKYIYSLIESEE